MGVPVAQLIRNNPNNVVVGGAGGAGVGGGGGGEARRSASRGAGGATASDDAAHHWPVTRGAEDGAVAAGASSPAADISLAVQGNALQTGRAPHTGVTKGSAGDYDARTMTYDTPSGSVRRRSATVSGAGVAPRWRRFNSDNSVTSDSRGGGSAAGIADGTQDTAAAAVAAAAAGLARAGAGAGIGAGAGAGAGADAGAGEGRVSPTLAIATHQGSGPTRGFVPVGLSR